MSFNQFICGKLLGDGCITKQDKRKPRFQFMHRVEDFGWSLYCYEELKDEIPLNPPVYRKVADKRLKKGFSESYVVQSKTNLIITELHEIWYPEGKKKLPIRWVQQYLDERALAWWYQDDGHLKMVNGVASKIILSTDSFSSEENEFLMQLLWDNWRLKFSIDGQNRLILYDQFQIIYFVHLISPWIHESMDRKILPTQPLRTIAKRTSIYLPTTYKIEKPTVEINMKLSTLSSLYKDPFTRTVCLDHIFHTFHPLIRKQEKTIGYQIVIEQQHRTDLAKIRQQTGLTVSQLADYCFSYALKT
ncbi:endonuclease [Sporosarcina sp. ACRSL]|uniref:endonuclease n=1 Tax=Sporosarcina sp. ACRSL TaxID=2918215 RepID=UPI001EF568A9|nr:endonuclease [Sporosarcina sp. ACRSL]MCG7344359.1 endonuclease [Sporosarcina sp. ACRSL]